MDRRAALLAELARMLQVSAAGSSEREAETTAPPDPAGQTALPSLPQATPPYDAPPEGTPHPFLPLLSMQPEGARRTDRHELSGRTVGRLLLGAGAVLVMIATTVFTVASWSRIGPLGRCAILLAVSAVVLVAPVLLRRRALTATAETVAATGLALTVADAYLALRLMRADGLFVLAAACAALAALWAAYGLAAKLRIPRLAALAAAQIPGLILTVALVRTFRGPELAGPIALALVLTSGTDFVVSRWMSRRGHRAELVTASIFATTTWAAAVLLALHNVTANTSSALWMSGVLLTAGAIGVGLRPDWMPVVPAAALSGALLAIGSAVPAARALPSDWKVVPFAVAGAVVAGVALVVGRMTFADVGDPADAGGDPAEQGEPADAGDPAEHGEQSPVPRLVATGSAAVAGLAGLTEVHAAAAGMFPLQRFTQVWSGPAWPPAASHLLSGALAPAAVLAAVSLACWLAPLSRQFWQRVAALAFAGLAAGSVPAAGLDGWAALALLTAAAMVMLGVSAGLGKAAAGRPLAAAALWTGIGLSVAALLWSLTWPDATITELVVLTVAFGLVAALARTPAVARIATGFALAAMAGVAWAVPMASGWPARHAAFAVLGVAVVAAGAATLLRNKRPEQAVILDVGAGPVVVLAAAMSAHQAATFALLAAVAALTASSAAWLRAGRRRVIAACAATFAALAAIAADGRSLALALFRPYGQLAAPWHGHVEVAVPASAVIIVGACAVAVVIAAGAWRDGQASLHAVAIALPVVIPAAGLASGLGYGTVVGLLLALALALTAWSAVSRSLVPAGAALATASLALAWALAEREATLAVLGCLAVAYPLCSWRARQAEVRIASASLSVLSAASLAEAAVLAGGSPAWQAGLAMVAVAAGAHLAAWLLGSARLGGESRGADRTAIEAAAWLAVTAGTAQCLGRPGPASLALGISGLVAAGVAMRRDRRPALWVGVGLCQAAWSVWLFAAQVTAPEPYTVPAAAVWIALGWRLQRRFPSSWLTFGPGLALLLVPSLIAVWHDPGWVRPLSLGVAAATITLIGARVRRQAPLLIGAAVTVLDAGHELAPEIRRLAEAVPSWLPIALAGAILLWAGATYEARLRNIAHLRKVVAAMR